MRVEETSLDPNVAWASEIGTLAGGGSGAGARTDASEGLGVG